MPSTFRCPVAARWLPHALAAAVLAALTIVSQPGDSDPSRSSFLRPIVIVVGAGLGLWVLRRGAVLRRQVTLGAAGMSIALGRRERTLEYRDVASIDARIPFEASWQWVPTVVVVDVFEHSWEIPMAIDDGPRLLETFLDRCDRDDLRVWADARSIRRRLSRGPRFVPIAYAVAVLLVVGAIWIQA